MLKFHPLKVASVERVAQDAVCVTLEVPQTLREDFKFDAGQYVTVRRMIGGKEERRTYSIVTAPVTWDTADNVAMPAGVAAPDNAALRIGVREQSGGLMSREIATVLRAGDMLDVGTPYGRFRTTVDPERVRSYVAFAAGSGITPVLSLIAELLARELNSRFTLVYGNRSVARTMFLEDTLALKNRYLDRFAVHFVMSREPQQTPLLNGRIDGAKVAELAGKIFDPSTVDEYFICGPGSMVDDVRTTLKSLSDGKSIRFERFAAGTSPAAARTDGAVVTINGSVATAAPAVSPTPPMSQATLASITVTMDGRRRTFSMFPDDPSVLAAGERAGLELPFSCRSGICATCRVKIIAGSAVMTHNIALEPWEIDAGFVLCCQARPTGTSLELSYDEK